MGDRKVGGSRKMAAMPAAAAKAARGGGAGNREITSARTSPAWLLVAFALGQWTLESCSATADISIVTVTTPTELSVQAGANVKLPCIFISSEEISTATSVTWSFQQKGSTARPITFLYYSDGKQYNGKNTLFNGRSSWAGNLTMRDASIKIENVQPADNGTYFCDVKNPPDIVAEPGQIKVKVLEEEITVDYGRAAVTPENTIIITKTTTSGNILLNGESFWQLVLQFCCILASFLSNLF